MEHGAVDFHRCLDLGTAYLALNGFHPLGKSLFVFEVILCSIIEIEDVFFILLAELLSLLECHAEVPFTSAFAKVIKIGENAMISVQNP